ncbi:hypothetical protein BT63DRAFT_430078 [Microthyrium microscopicum]|uniref:Cytochrome b-c1 complex subunit 7 n=1 Tax=Microthyrium microscopicum TaxID=703497 RepID=A0A6A6TVP6_9PEZI|nr:hypothetical protein BT63DRAFT_430078 [Microthyrium microscopicum]
MPLFTKGYTAFTRAVAKPVANSSLLTSMANAIQSAAGYRALGLRADDLIPEENEVVQKALSRLSPQEHYDRVFRLRRGFQLSLAHHLLPPHEQTKPEEDICYLSPYIAEIEAENQEREDLDAVIVERKAKS